MSEKPFKNKAQYLEKIGSNISWVDGNKERMKAYLGDFEDYDYSKPLTHKYQNKKKEWIECSIQRTERNHSIILNSKNIGLYIENTKIVKLSFDSFGWKKQKDEATFIKKEYLKQQNHSYETINHLYLRASHLIRRLLEQPVNLSIQEKQNLEEITKDLKTLINRGNSPQTVNNKNMLDLEINRDNLTEDVLLIERKYLKKEFTDKFQNYN